MTRRILVPVDFSPCSDAALELALTLADASGAEVELLHVWRVHERADASPRSIFADTPEGIAMEQRLSAADRDHPARVCGRLEFGDDPSSVILHVLRSEGFDLVVLGEEGEGGASGENSSGADSSGDPTSTERCGPVSGHVAACVVRTAPCKVVTTRPAPPPPASSSKIVAA